MASLTRLVMSYFDPAKCGSPGDVDTNFALCNFSLHAVIVYSRTSAYASGTDTQE